MPVSIVSLLHKSAPVSIVSLLHKSVPVSIVSLLHKSALVSVADAYFTSDFRWYVAHTYSTYYSHLRHAYHFIGIIFRPLFNCIESIWIINPKRDRIAFMISFLVTHNGSQVKEGCIGLYGDVTFVFLLGPV